MTKFNSENDVINEVALLLRTNKSTVENVCKAIFETVAFDIFSQGKDERIVSSIIPYFGKVVFVRDKDAKEIVNSFLSMKENLNEVVAAGTDKDLLADYCEKSLSLAAKNKFLEECKK